MIGDIASVDESDENQVRSSPIKDPVRSSGWHDEDVALFELADLLVLVSELRFPRLPSSSQIRLVRLGTARNHDTLDAGAFNNVDEFGCVNVSRQKQTSRPDCMADHAHSGALELIVVLVPHLGETGLGVGPVSGLLSSEIVETTGPLRVEAVVLPRLAPMDFPGILSEAEIGKSD